MSRTYLLIQAILIACGVAFSWTTIISLFVALYASTGTIFSPGIGLITNPVFTPCFYGGLAFIAAFAWSLQLFLSYSRSSQRYLSYFLLFGVCFAASVIGVELCQYYRVLGGPIIACVPGAYPLTGPCAIGGLIYLISFIWSRITLRLTHD